MKYLKIFELNKQTYKNAANKWADKVDIDDTWDSFNHKSHGMTRDNNVSPIRRDVMNKYKHLSTEYKEKYNINNWKDIYPLLTYEDVIFMEIHKLDLYLELGGDPNKEKVDKTLLVFTITNNFITEMEMLINAGADINKTLNGKEPIEYAVLYDNMEAVKLLLEHNVNITKPGFLLETCIVRCNLEMLEMLLENGLDSNLIEKDLVDKSYEVDEDIYYLIKKYQNK